MYHLKILDKNIITFNFNPQKNNRYLVIDSIRGKSIKRQFFKNLVVILLVTRLYKIFFKCNIEKQFKQLIVEITKKVGINDKKYVITYSPQTYRKRLYIVSEDSTSEDLLKFRSYFKVAFGDKDNSLNIKEYAMIKALYGYDFSFDLPKVNEIFIENKYVVLDFSYDNYCPIPISDTFIKRAITDLKTTNRKTKVLGDLDWWNETDNRTKSLCKNTYSIEDTTLIRTVLAHGDIHKGNLRCNGTRYVLTDWEMASFNCPEHTDIVSSTLATFRNRDYSNPSNTIIKLKSMLLTTDLVLVLVYLKSKNHSGSIILLDYMLNSSKK